MAAIDSLRGQTLGQCELRELLGSSGVAAVYRAYQHAARREVAVKVMSGQSAGGSEFLGRFNAEVRTASKLEHAGIVPIYDFGIQSDLAYLVMRYLTGGSLHERMRIAVEQGRDGPSPAEISELLAQMASALDYARHKGVVHHGIRPQNILFDNRGKPYIAGFGTARLLQQDLIPAAMPYIPPEQWRGEGIGHPSDQYALAVIVYQLIAGRPPFEADGRQQWMYQHLHEQPLELAAVRPGLPDAVTLVLARALAKTPAERFRNCTLFAQSFASAIEGAGGAPSNYFAFKLPKRERAKPPSAVKSPPAADSQPPAAESQPPAAPVAPPLPPTRPISRSAPAPIRDQRPRLVAGALAAGLLAVVLVSALLAGNGQTASGLSLSPTPSNAPGVMLLASETPAGEDPSSGGTLPAIAIQAVQYDARAVAFQLSGDGITEAAWDFGDGRSAEGLSPSHRYDAPGAYQVSVEAKGPGGSAAAVETVVVAEGCGLTPVRDEAKIFAQPVTVHTLSTLGAVPAAGRVFTTESVRGRDGFIWYRVYHGDVLGWVHSTAVQVSDGVCP